MRGVLLDTCVISELVKVRPKPGLLAWLKLQSNDRLFLSVMSLGEIEKGIAKCPDEKRREQLVIWLENDLTRRFQQRILPVSLQIASVWGQMTGDSERLGRSLPVVDALIAATAKVADLTVATRNTRDFERCSVRVFNPWEFEDT
jgi:predicted nucleic acid-binding protein